MHNLFREKLVSARLLVFGVTAATVSPIMIFTYALAQVTTPTPDLTPIPTIVPTIAPTPTIVPTIAPTPTPDLTTTPTPTPDLTTTPTPTTTTTPTPATTFSDVGPNYWARPFIQALAEKNVITGFLDGTFKPNQPVDRTEFAVMIQKAFNQNPVRQLSQGGFKDVPPDYWAASAIKQAYETGFMSGYPGNLFLPNQPIPKFQGIAALADGLNLTTSGTASEVVNTYYTDAKAIPNYAVKSVAAATQANIVVNYPNVRKLNPLAPLTRAEAAALLYQAKIKQGAQPLKSDLQATNYIVGRTTETSQTTPTTTTKTSQDIFSRAASSQSFRTLTSLLKTAGLANILQEPGPFTVFAPTDQAFAALPGETLRRLQESGNKETLIKILKYHVVPGKLTASELSAGKLKTFEGKAVNVKIVPPNNQIEVNGAKVILPNIQASNGVIHAVNNPSC